MSPTGEPYGWKGNREPSRRPATGTTAPFPIAALVAGESLRSDGDNLDQLRVPVAPGFPLSPIVANRRQRSASAPSTRPVRATGSASSPGSSSA